MIHQSRKSVSTSRDQKGKMPFEAPLASRPELTLTSDIAIDPRLVDIIRLLARRAARQHFQTEMKLREKPGSR